MVWDEIWEYSIWPTKWGRRPKLTSDVAPKTCQNVFELHTCGWFRMRFENIKSDPQKEVRGKLTSEVTSKTCQYNFIFVDGLGWDLRIFKLTHQKRSDLRILKVTCLPKGRIHSKKKLVKYHNFGTDPPPLKVVKTQFFFTQWPDNH